MNQPLISQLLDQQWDQHECAVHGEKQLCWKFGYVCFPCELEFDEMVEGYHKHTAVED